MNISKFIRLFAISFILFVFSQATAAASTAPPNKPAEISINGTSISLVYESTPILQGQIFASGKNYKINRVIAKKEGLITQLLTFTTLRPQDSIEIQGKIFSGQESFPCEVDRRDHGLTVVRHSSGPSHSRLNRAVYDRARDWVLSVDHNPSVRITPISDSASGRTYAVKITGSEIIIRFRPRYYQKHRGLKYFEPWTYRIWPKPIVGWCSWFAYFSNITEENIKETADVLSEVLLPYGYDYLQIDDGYQRGQGLPELWLKPNMKFPNGLKHLAKYIKKKGLIPGIWTNVAFNQMGFAEKNKDLFVLDKKGHPAQGNWVDISIDGSNPEAINRLVRPIYRGLKDMAWDYFKVDALRHLRYEGYNSYPDHFREKQKDRVEAFRNLVKAVREEIGKESFMMGCWGIRPELIGIIDGCRIGTDGYSFAGLSQYNSFNNVVWLNDPDHIELSPEEAYRSTMATSLTGSLFLLTDKPEVYRTNIVDPAKRAAPVLFTQPGQIYDVDPSRSQNLHLVDTEVTGSGPRLFDAGRTPTVHLFLLEINRSFENWVLLGRTGGEDKNIPFYELGLDPSKEYYVFEFWSKMLMGSYSGEFASGKIDPLFNCQLFCIRERLDHPQIIATNRHITCGGFELDDVRWEDLILSGKSRVIKNDPYVLYVSEPPGYKFKNVRCTGAKVKKIEKTGMMQKIVLQADNNGSINWTIEYIKN